MYLCKYSYQDLADWIHKFNSYDCNRWAKCYVKTTAVQKRPIPARPNYHNVSPVSCTVGTRGERASQCGQVNKYSTLQFQWHATFRYFNASDLTRIGQVVNDPGVRYTWRSSGWTLEVAFSVDMYLIQQPNLTAMRSFWRSRRQRIVLLANVQNPVDCNNWDCRLHVVITAP